MGRWPHEECLERCSGQWEQAYAKKALNWNMRVARVAFSRQTLPAGPLWPHPLLGRGAAEVDEACPDPLGAGNPGGWGGSKINEAS